MIVAAIYISMYGIACTNDGSQERKKPDVIFCDQISACIPFLKEVPILSWLLPYSPKVITLIYLNYEPWILHQNHTFLEIYFLILCLEDRILLPLSRPTTN